MAEEADGVLRIAVPLLNNNTTATIVVTARRNCRTDSMAVSETLVSVGRSVGHQRSSMHAHMACRLFISYLWPFSCELIPHHAYLHACSTQAKIVPLSEGPPSSCAKTVDARCTEDGVSDSSSSEEEISSEE